MCDVDYDPPSFTHTTSLKARKIHKCIECGRQIEPKEIYEKTVDVWDSRFDTFKTCVHCVAARQWLLDKCGGFYYGGVHEDLFEHAREYNMMKLYRYCIAMTNKWKYKKSLQLMPVPI